MAYALRALNRVAASALLKPSAAFPGSCLAAMSAGPAKQDTAAAAANFFEKNKKLSRPLSPDLSIYAPQVTWVLSIFHRLTGCGLGVVLYGMGMAPLLASHQFPYYLEALRAMHISPVLLFPVKFGLAAALCYHALNGMRHLAWDLGLGFQLKQLYMTGYSVLALSIILGFMLACK